MGMYKYIRKIWKNPKDNEFYRERILKWKEEPATVRIEYPTRIDRARSLGYRAKQGILIIRQRVKRGKRQRPQIRKGRRPRHMSRKKDLRISYQVIAEIRAQKKYLNCTVLNSYKVGEDKDFYWYEVILVDRDNPHIRADPNLNWICCKRGRAVRGITSAGRKSRALDKKGKGAEKVRPSLRANQRRAR